MTFPPHPAVTYTVNLKALLTFVRFGKPDDSLADQAAPPYESWHSRADDIAPCSGLQISMRLRLSAKQSNARAAALFPDKSDARLFQRPLHGEDGGTRDVAARLFKIDNG